MTPQVLMSQALQALSSSRLLLEANDPRGACNRAYYSMFDAARASLLYVKAPVPAEIAKTHNGLIRAFSLHIIKTGLFPVELGKAINRVEDLRLTADYSGDPMEKDAAISAIEQADAFLTEITARFNSRFYPV